MLSSSSGAEVTRQVKRWYRPTNPRDAKTQDFKNTMIIVVRTSNLIFLACDSALRRPTYAFDQINSM
jgi:hypothetical protein